MIQITKRGFVEESGGQHRGPKLGKVAPLSSKRYLGFIHTKRYRTIRAVFDSDRTECRFPTEFNALPARSAGIVAVVIDLLSPHFSMIVAHRDAIGRLRSDGVSQPSEAFGRLVEDPD